MIAIVIIIVSNYHVFETSLHPDISLGEALGLDPNPNTLANFSPKASDPKTPNP